MGHPLSNFWWKKIDQVMSGRGAMTSQEVQRQAIFARNGGLEGDIDHGVLWTFLSHD